MRIVVVLLLALAACMGRVHHFRSIGEVHLDDMLNKVGSSDGNSLLLEEDATVAKNSHPQAAPATNVITNRNRMAVVVTASGRPMTKAIAQRAKREKQQLLRQKRQRKAPAPPPPSSELLEVQEKRKTEPKPESDKLDFVGSGGQQQRQKQQQQKKNDELKASKRRVAEEVKKAQKDAETVNRRSKLQEEYSKKLAKENGIALANNWVTVDTKSQWMHVGLYKWGSLCFLNGRVYSYDFGAGSSLVMTLAPHCRPTQRVMFSVAQDRDTPARVDVLSDGRVFVVLSDVGQQRQQHGKTNWISLDGVFFNTAGQLQSSGNLQLDPRWLPYGQPFEEPQAAVFESLVFVSGVIRRSDSKDNSQWTILGRLPTPSTPATDLIFSLCNGDNTTNVEVHRNGDVVYSSGSSSHGWLSLAGIVYSTKGGILVPLQTGWKNYGSGYRRARHVRLGNLCLVSGVVIASDASSDNLIAVLPANCRPSKRLTFLANDGSAVHGLLHVSPKGELFYISPNSNKEQNYVSLDSIHFIVVGGNRNQ